MFEILRYGVVQLFEGLRYGIVHLFEGLRYGIEQLFEGLRCGLLQFVEELRYKTGMLWVWLHCHNSPGRNMTLVLNQPLTETSTSDVS